ncbi:phosphodiesterase [Roseobacter litoralis]|uniref:Calcineurin-like phosphoesterase n=1 Tax=Roseobacter litoralis (strain ATCC 49566 / DSM 6996 / JCM 21268 / NBRC 15278 / OCh 149) TaxID=391595 RepID=F7Z9X4_ROSLO|nr:phosphodiesterase [Roseobacter litoralis]AEI92933.1 calcineurin-like phosphoesterase [Roseobacter litoralis Och 149]
MKLVHISDIHLTVPGERMGGLNPHRRFAQALDDVRTQHRDAARIIITGDLTHWGESAAYATLVDALTDLPCPVRLLIGNHDDRAAFLAAFPDHPKDAAGFINYAETVDGTRLIYLDTTEPGTHAGHFCAARRDWLEAELMNCARARLFVHHNPMALGLPAEDKIALVPEDRASLAELLSTYRGRIDYIHFGHVHAPVHGTWCGISFASVRSTGNQSLPDLTEQELLQGAPMAPSYGVILAQGTDTVIHEIPFTWDGPIFSAGTKWDDWAKPVAAE